MGAQECLFESSLLIIYDIPYGQFVKTSDVHSDIDVIEAQLDDAVRHLIADVYHGAAMLQEQVGRHTFKLVIQAICPLILSSLTMLQASVLSSLTMLL